MNYAKAIRVARSLADLSQGELADRANIDRSYLSLIESDKRVPTIETLEKLAASLELPFHLLSLLGSEAEDVQNANSSQVSSLAIALTELLMKADTSGKKKKPSGASSDKRSASKEPPRTRILDRSKA